MTTISVYDTKPIKDGQIRVLCLYPGNFAAPLQGHLDVVNLEDAGASRPNLDPDPWEAEFNDDQTLFRHWRDLYQSYFNAVRALKEHLARLNDLISATEELCREREHLSSTLENLMSSSGTESSCIGEKYLRGPGDLERLTEDWLHESRETSLKSTKNTWGHMMPIIGPVFDPFILTLSVLMIKVTVRRDELVREACSGAGYEAVSYAWGPPDMTEYILLEDCHTTLAITPALHDVLIHLRPKDRVRRLWVDAICINQLDVTERTQQVLRMANIFSAAARVLVWLGREQSSSDAIALCAIANCHIKRQFDLTFWAPYKCRMLCGDTIYCSCCGNAVAPYGAVNDTESAMRQLSFKPWFKRLWVVQEAAVASHAEIICGAHRLPWSALSAAAKYANTSRLDHCLNAMSTARSLHQLPHSPRVLLKLLVDAANKDCSDARDRIFAIQDVVKLQPSRDTLDLSYHLSVEEIFTRVTVHCLSSADPLKHARLTDTRRDLPPVSVILALVGTESTRRDDLPSWVPDFHSLSTRSQVKAQEYAYHWAQDEANALVCRAEYPARQLSLRGRKIASITSVLEASSCPQGYPAVALSRRETWAAEEPNVYQWYDRCRRFAGQRWESADNFDFRLKELLLCADRSLSLGLYLRRMVGSMNWFRLASSSQITPDDILQILCDKIPVARDQLTADHFARWTCEGFLRGRVTLTDLDHYDRGRNLSAMQMPGAVTDLGWVPQTTEVGDLVCSFVGAPRPFVLRPCEGGVYRLLGDCWIHGFHGADETRQDRDDVEWLTLC